MPLFAPVSREELARFRRESRQRREPWAFATACPRRWTALLRRVRFAQANRLAYIHEMRAPRYPGVLFGVGEHRRAEGCFRRLDAPEFDLGSYRFSTGDGRSRAVQRWGYVAMRLPRRLPHMVLDALGNNSLLGGAPLPLAFAREQVLSLEGDFDRHFTLYCPTQYERDALYIFTPDLMALLIDESGAFDVEVVDDWMFLYRRGGLAIDDPATLRGVFRIIDTVGARLRRRTERYADERIGDRAVDLVTPRGERLRRAAPAASAGLVAVAAVIAVVVSRLSG